MVSVPARALLLVAMLSALVGGCAKHVKSPTFAGAELYARVPVLQQEGQVMVPTNTTPVKVRIDQVLVTPDRTQMFAVRAVIENCLGGRPEAEPECTLAALRDLRFEVHDTQPIRDLPHPDEEGEGMGFYGKALITGLVLAAPLTYGVATCEFDGCQAVFGIPLTAVGLGVLFLLIGMK